MTTNKYLLTYDNTSNHSLKKYPAADRIANPEYAQASILNKITFPTGGYTEFEYEGNKDDKGNNVGGLRVKNVISYTQHNSAPIVRSYQYEKAIDNISNYILGTTYTQAKLIIIPATTNTAGDQYYRYHDYLLSEPSLPLSYSGGAPVFYSKVVEYEGYPEDSNGKTDNFFNFSSNDIQVILLSHCTLPQTYFIPKLKHSYEDRGWTRGQLVGTNTYKKKNGEFSLVKRTSYKYEEFNTKYFNVGFKSFSNFDTASLYIINQRKSVPELFQYSNLRTYTGLLKLTQVKESTYNEDKVVTQVTTHSYDRLQNQHEITSTTQTNSDGSVLTKNYKYPKDFAAQSNRYSKISNQNILSPVVEQTDFLDNIFVQTATTDYRLWSGTGLIDPFGNYNVVPDQISIKRGEGNAEVELKYNDYDDMGNILSISKRNGFEQSFIWGYGKTLPVAKLDNISYSTVKSNSDLSQIVH